MHYMHYIFSFSVVNKLFLEMPIFLKNELLELSKFKEIAEEGRFFKKLVSSLC
jgi:hypothetical protein